MDTNDEDQKAYDFGWWPEIFGGVGIGLLIWFLIAFARGSLRAIGSMKHQSQIFGIWQ